MAEKVAVYDVITGAMLLRWSVDARECVAGGAYSYAPPAPEAPAAPADEAEAVEVVVDAPAVRRKRR